MRRAVLLSAIFSGFLVSLASKSEPTLLEPNSEMITASADGLELSDARAETNVMAGVSLAWPVEVGALSDTTVRVSGLPPGLKFTAKDIIDRKTEELVVQANTIYGTPAVASKPGRPYLVKITVMTADETKRVFELALTVIELSNWAVGKFNGGSSIGQVSLLVLKNGRMNGKWLSGGKTWILSGVGYDGHLEESEQTHETLFAPLQAKTWNETEMILIGVTPYGLTGYDGMGILFTADSFDWTSGELKELGAQIARAPSLTYEVDDLQPGMLTLTFGANGRVKVLGRFQTDPENEKLIAKASGSAVLCPMDEAHTRFCVYVYLPPKGAFEGYSEARDLMWNGKEFSVEED